MSVDPRIMVLESGALPERCRVKVLRDNGASLPSKKSGDSTGVSRLLRKRVFDVTDGDVGDTRTLGLRRRGDPEVGTDVRGVWGTSSEPGRSPIGRSLTFELSREGRCRWLSDSRR